MKQFYQILKPLAVILFFCSFTNGFLYASHPEPTWCGVNNIQTNRHGSDGADPIIHLGSTNDLYLGLGGDDDIRGNEGNDCINGNGGDDEIRGNDGIDYLHGGGGDDLIKGGKERDHIFGDKGKDTIYGECGNDYLSGKEDHDTYVYRRGDGNDDLYDENPSTLLFVNINEDEVSYEPNLREYIIHSTSPKGRIHIWGNDNITVDHDRHNVSLRKTIEQGTPVTLTSLGARWEDRFEWTDNKGRKHGTGHTMKDTPSSDTIYYVTVTPNWRCPYTDVYHVFVKTPSPPPTPVPPPPPVIVADFVAKETKVEAPFTVKFTDLSTVSNTRITYHNWDFNSTDSNNNPDSFDPNPSYTFTKPGFYSISLKVGDGSVSDTKEKLSYIEVYDESPPVVNRPDDLFPDAIRETGNEVGEIVFPPLTATDNVEVTKGPTCALPDFFPLNERIEVVCTAEDAAGLVGSTSFFVQVTDQSPPVFDPIPDPLMVKDATLPDGAKVDYLLPAVSDNVGVVLGPISDPLPKEKFFLNEITTVNCWAEDEAGHRGETSFEIEVRDLSPPVLTASDLTPETLTSLGIEYYNYPLPSVTDIVGVTVGPVCEPPPNTFFYLDVVTPVACWAEDAAGKKGWVYFTITVEDNIPPIVTTSGDLTFEATDPLGAEVSYSPPTATDIVSVVIGPSCDYPSDTYFPIGVTTVNCSAEDQAGNTGEASFEVLVEDTTPPETTLISAIDGLGNDLPDGGWSLSSSISFSFSGSDLVGVGGFECELNGQGFSLCDSPYSLVDLSLGEHQFQVFAFDTAAPIPNVDETPVLFTWRVLTPAEGTGELIDIILDMDLPKGTETSLTAPLSKVEDNLNDGNSNNDKAVCNSISAFINQVEAKTGNGKIAVEDADSLNVMADDLKTSLECKK